MNIEKSVKFPLKKSIQRLAYDGKTIYYSRPIYIQDMLF